jgi:transcription-repair coupling factor (superfamily II helicase)
MADRLGLAQMYQIRGRVGRSDRVSYAYFMFEESKVLTENGLKRLNAIKEFTTLGSGYKIAVRDLAIRGAGDYFGSGAIGIH